MTVSVNWTPDACFLNCGLSNLISAPQREKKPHVKYKGQRQRGQKEEEKELFSGEKRFSLDSIKKCLRNQVTYFGTPS
jgi:hypothetical protein